MKWKLGTSSNVAGKLCILWCYDELYAFLTVIQSVSKDSVWHGLWNISNTLLPVI